MAKIPLDRNGKITLLKWLQAGAIDTNDLHALNVEPIQIEIIDKRYMADDITTEQRSALMCDEIKKLGLCPFCEPDADI
ncbi:MAG: hypothetical protein LUD17_09005 [Bacteroidales bacterium]|nr:hypothetical protein [Bacteroidales bacterium]